MKSPRLLKFINICWDSFVKNSSHELYHSHAINFIGFMLQCSNKIKGLSLVKVLYKNKYTTA